MYKNPNAYRSVPIGVVLQQAPGVTRWQKWSWKATGVLTGAGPSDWRVLRKDGEITEYHADTVPLELHGAEVEAYLHELTALTPCVYIVMRDGQGAHPYDILTVTASPYEAQDYTDSGEEVVEKVIMPPMLKAFVRDFVDEFYEEEEFIKRKRD